MRSLILKMFIRYWIAAGLVLLFVDLNPHEQLHRPEATEALSAALRLHGAALIKAYEAGGCPAAAPMVSDSTETMSLVSSGGYPLCTPEPAAGLQSLIVDAAKSKAPIATNFRTFQVVAQSVSSPSGKPYVVLLKSSFKKPIPYGLVPGSTTIIISGVVTVLLSILIALPIQRLRSAARDIANGHLEARVKWGKGLGVVGGFPDSDVLHDLIIDFNHMAGRLQSLVAAQRLLFRDVSHELRSPLARLSVALELARVAGPPSMKVPLDRIETEVARVNDLIGQLLSLAQMETVQELSQPASLSLGELVKSVIPDVQYEANGRGCRVITRTLEDCVVYGDSIMLQRAIENVIRNAIRYTPENGVVAVDVEQLQSGGSRVAVVRVEDSGPGVPVEELTAILRPFYRVDKSRQRATGGFGVGLAIADRAVKLHSGAIKATNRSGGGLVVEIDLPHPACRRTCRSGGCLKLSLQFSRMRQPCLPLAPQTRSVSHALGDRPRK